MTRNMPGTTEIGPVFDIFVSGDHGPLSIDIEASSPRILQRYEEAVELRSGHVNRQHSHHTLMGGADMVSRSGGTAVAAHAQPEDPHLCIEKPINETS